MIDKNIGPALVRVLAEVFGNERQAALSLGVHQAQFSRWKRGQQSPGVRVLRRIHRGCPECRPLIDGLFGEED